MRRKLVGWMCVGAAFALLASSGEASEKTARDLREIRASLPPGDECDERRDLVVEIPIPPGGEPRSLVTIHRGKECWTDRLAVWRREGTGYRARHVFDEGSAGAEVLHFKGKDFVVLTQTQPSAGRSWAGNVLLAVTGDSDLLVVPFSGVTRCGSTLPPLGESFEHSTGGFYSFGDGDLRFEWNVWKPDDSPNFPAGGLVTGTLTIVESPHSESGLRLVVEDCRVWSPEEADERGQPGESSDQPIGAPAEV